jgi:chemotaxis regulatin CheY-phosphate phosphatase CheZ
MSLGSELIVAIPAGVAALALMKRLSTFDLELRTHRARKRREWESAIARLGVEEALDRAQSWVSEAAQRLRHAEQLAMELGGKDGALNDDALALVTPYRKQLGAAHHLLAELKIEARRTTEAGELRIAMPAVLLAMLRPEDAGQYTLEWEAHLRERIDAGEVREARGDRRTLVRYALMLALTSRVRRFAQRARS